MRLSFALTALLLLSGCASEQNVQVYAKVDPKQKTITVPSGSSGFKGAVKKALSERGWKLVVYGGPEITEGSSGSNTYLQKYSTFNTRYTLAGR